MSSRGLCESWPVLSNVFKVQTWHSVNPFDLGKCGEDVEFCIWWHYKNCVSSSDAKGCLLSVKSRDGGPY